jgi:hypothetical protein
VNFHDVRFFLFYFYCMFLLYSEYFCFPNKSFNVVWTCFFYFLFSFNCFRFQDTIAGPCGVTTIGFFVCFQIHLSRIRHPQLAIQTTNYFNWTLPSLPENYISTLSQQPCISNSSFLSYCMIDFVFGIFHFF